MIRDSLARLPLNLLCSAPNSEAEKRAIQACLSCVTHIERNGQPTEMQFRVVRWWTSAGFHTGFCFIFDQARISLATRAHGGFEVACLAPDSSFASLCFDSRRVDDDENLSEIRCQVILNPADRPTDRVIKRFTVCGPAVWINAECEDISTEINPIMLISSRRVPARVKKRSI